MGLYLNVSVEEVRSNFLHMFLELGIFLEESWVRKSRFGFVRLRCERRMLETLVFKSELGQILFMIRCCVFQIQDL